MLSTQFYPSRSLYITQLKAQHMGLITHNAYIKKKPLPQQIIASKPRQYSSLISKIQKQLALIRCKNTNANMLARGNDVFKHYYMYDHAALKAIYEVIKKERKEITQLRKPLICIQGCHPKIAIIKPKILPHLTNVHVRSISSEVEKPKKCVESAPVSPNALASENKIIFRSTQRNIRKPTQSIGVENIMDINCWKSHDDEPNDDEFLQYSERTKETQ